MGDSQTREQDPASCVYLEGRDFSTHEIKTDWDKRIENGELSLGKPCHPQKNKPNFWYGRKIPLLELRHESLMHWWTASDELLTKRNVTDYADNTYADNTLKDLLKKTERTRCIGLWRTWLCSNHSESVLWVFKTESEKRTKRCA